MEDLKIVNVNERDEDDTDSVDEEGNPFAKDLAATNIFFATVLKNAQIQ